MAAGPLLTGVVQEPLPDFLPDRLPAVEADRIGCLDFQGALVARWWTPPKNGWKAAGEGQDVDFKELLRMEPDGGTTNIRNVKSKHWTRWLGPENRCVVPFSSFSEFNKAEGGDIWFALNESRPLACFAGIWANWKSVRKVKEGETTNDLYASSRRSRTPRSAPSTPRRCPW
jgi:hypothetical protein